MGGESDDTIIGHCLHDVGVRDHDGGVGDHDGGVKDGLWAVDGGHGKGLEPGGTYRPARRRGRGLSRSPRLKIFS